jgi:hypothetical protein
MNSAIWISIWRVSLVVEVALISAVVLQLLLRALERHLKDQGASGDRLPRLITIINAGRRYWLHIYPANDFTDDPARTWD